MLKPIFAIGIVVFLLGCKHELPSTDKGLSHPAYASRSIEKRHALIEMYTNASVSYTVDSYKVYDEIRSAIDSKTQLIRIESGPLFPAGFFPNFKTEQGDSLVERLEVVAMPVGVINRTGFIGKSISGFNPAMGRQFWQSTVQDIIAIPSKVNIGGKAVFDKSTNELTIETELYFTGNEDLPSQLHIALLESNVVQPQKNSGSFYPHNNLLCQHLTGIDGEEIEGKLEVGVSKFGKRSIKLQDSYFQNSHGHDLTANPENFTLLVFMTENHRKVETVVEIPIIIN